MGAILNMGPAYIKQAPETGDVLLSPPGEPRGVGYMLGSALFFSLMAVLVKAAGERLPASMMVLARGVVTLVLSYGLLSQQKISPWGTQRPLLLLRGALGFLALSCFYYSLTVLPLAHATLIQHTNPLFTAVLAALWLRERIEPVVLAAIALGACGITLITKPGWLAAGEAMSLPPLALLIALGGALFSGCAYVLVRKLAATEHPLVVVFYFPLVAVPATLPFVLPNLVWPTLWEWLLLLGIGVTTQIAQILMTKGLKYETAGRATSIGFSQVALAGVWGVLLFGEDIDATSIAGAALIFFGIVLLITVRRRPAASP